MLLDNHYIVRSRILLVVTILCSTLDGTVGNRFSTLDLSRHYPPPASTAPPPSSENVDPVNINVTTQQGTHAYLPCKVQQIGNKPVSWIRVRDGHILTVDRTVFIADQRFVILDQPSKLWTLQIKYVQDRDAGLYECQVSTEPKVSARVLLDVVVPRTEILGELDRFVKAGSIVVLRCIIRGALEPPIFIIWYHNAQQILADSRRHRMQIDRHFPINEDDELTTIGSLIIEITKKQDSGNYTCSPSNSHSASVTLNVISGEHTASSIMSLGLVVQPKLLLVIFTILPMCIYRS